MEMSNKTARQLFEDLKANPTRKRFGFGQAPALINIDVQKAYTCVGEYPTAYETDPRQIEYINALTRVFREKNCPVVWTYVAYMDSGEDCGVWGTRSDTPDSLQNIKVGSRRSEFDDRCEIDHKPWVIGQPYRIGALENALDYMLARPGVWCATGAEILDIWKVQQ